MLRKRPGRADPAFDVVKPRGAVRRGGVGVKLLGPVRLRVVGVKRGGPVRRLLVGASGFEPLTFCSQSRRATKLRYAPPPSGSVSADRPPDSAAGPDGAGFSRPVVRCGSGGASAGSPRGQRGFDLAADGCEGAAPDQIVSEHFTRLAVSCQLLPHPGAFAMFVDGITE